MSLKPFAAKDRKELFKNSSVDDVGDRLSEHLFGQPWVDQKFKAKGARRGTNK